MNPKEITRRESSIPRLITEFPKQMSGKRKLKGQNWYSVYCKSLNKILKGNHSLTCIAVLTYSGHIIEIDSS